MIIGIPKEIKNNENRVSMTPSGVKELTKANHQVFVQDGAGEGSSFTNEEYISAGAQILSKIEEVYAISEMIVKVKEPIESEYKLIKTGQLVFTYFHFASSLPLTNAMVESKATCIAYETVQKEDKSLPLLTPMSEVAGRMAIQEGAKYLEKPFGGRGILLGGIPGVQPGHVLILGGGVVGTQAAKIAAGIGAKVTITDINLDRLRFLDATMPANVTTLMSSEYNIRQLLPHVDLVIGGILIPGGKAPALITKEMLGLMKKGAVLVDVAIDQGGCFETSHPTTHEDPTFEVDGILHYCVANMPGAVPYTSTLGLTNATLPYIIKLANKGWEKACQEDSELASGLNITDGKIVYKKVAEAWGLPYAG